MADPDRDRVSTDTTNRIFQPTSFFCKSCNVEILESEMDNHFQPTHKFVERCVYCKRPSYNYYTMSEQIKIWHKCPKRP